MLNNTSTSSSAMDRACESPGCGAPASLQCPTCVKLLLTPSYFCSQSCFKANWASHKTKHGVQAAKSKYNPFPDFDYTGACVALVCCLSVKEGE